MHFQQELTAKSLVFSPIILPLMCHVYESHMYYEKIHACKQAKIYSENKKEEGWEKIMFNLR